MSTLTISVDDAQNQLRDLLARARRGDEVLIAEGDKPIARLVSVETIAPEIVAPQQKRIAGLNRGAITWVSEDFDDPLPDEFWLGED
jgi:prevent-host-death family protein